MADAVTAGRDAAGTVPRAIAAVEPEADALVVGRPAGARRSIAPAQALPQELRREVRAVRPHERVVDREAREVRRVPERREDGAVELLGEVQLAFRAVVEPQPDAVTSEGAGSGDPWVMDRPVRG